MFIRQLLEQVGSVSDIDYLTANVKTKARTPVEVLAKFGNGIYRVVYTTTGSVVDVAPWDEQSNVHKAEKIFSAIKNRTIG